MKMNRRSRCCKFLGVVALPLSVATVVSLGNLAQAQIIPDETLGTEGSVVMPLNGQADRIDGGATRGSNLFHSFQEFNIAKGRGAYFANPAVIENIFSRVTGSNPSHLLGTLGVLGNANLFFLNPNGIIFGENASLDIRGSLVTSTASSLMFPDGERFSATNPQAPPLLEVDAPIPIGLQFEGEELGAIINAGELEAGGNLTLVGGTVASTGQLSAPGELISVAGVPEASLVKLGAGGQLLDWERSPITDDSEVEAGGLSLPELLTRAGDDTGLQFTSDGQMELVEPGIRFAANPGTVIVSGTIDASNTEPGQTGGKVYVLGDRVGLFDKAQINVSGDAGGGTVLIGGDFQGKGSLPNANRTYIASDVNINTDALTKGDGGRVIVWADEVTGFYGNISAKGGNVFGNGGLVEVSGKEQLIFRGNVDTSAPNGFPGILLLDPTNITIADGTGDEAGDGTDTFAGNNSGEAGSILSTPLSEINDTAPTTIYESELEGLSGDTNVFLQATNNITVDDLSDNELNFAAGSGAIAFTADVDRDGAGNFVMEDTTDTIKTNGRSIGISGASLTLGNIDTFGVAADGAGQLLDTAQIVGTESGVSLESISGNLSSPTDVDLFQLYLTGDGTFSASTVGGSEVASHLFLFDASGLGVYANDVQADCFCFQSNLPAKHPLTPPTPGIYYLGISVNDNDPISSGGEIFPDGFFPDGFDVYAPTGPGGASPLISWNGDSFNLGGSYTISLTGAEAPDSTFAETATANSGSITLNANNGSVSVGNLNASATGAGGSIMLNATRDILLKGPVTASGDFDDGSLINVQAGRNITLKEEVSFSSFSTDGNIILEANNDIKINNDLFSSDGSGGSLTFIADADGDSLGSFSMNPDARIFSGGRDVKISGASITGGDIRDGSSISLNTEGNINIGWINTSSSENAGSVSLKAGGDIINTGTFGGITSTSSDGNGGDISLKAGGDIRAMSLESFSRSDSRSDSGGSINLDSGGNINIEEPINSTAFGNGGDISLNARGDITNTGFILSTSSSGKGVDISLTAGGDIETRGIGSNSSNGGQGGAISLKAGGDIETRGIDSSVVDRAMGSSAFKRNGGAITLTAGGNITTEDLNSYSLFFNGNAENGGAITLTAEGNITTKDLTSFSYSETGDAGNGGAITLTARDGDIVGISSPTFASFSVSENGTAGNGGNVILKAKGNVTDIEILTLSSDSNSGTVNLTGFGDLSVTNTNIITSKQLTVDVPFFVEPIILDVGEEGQSGDVSVTSNGNLTFNNSRIESDTKGSDPAGNVNITSLGLITFNNSKIVSNSSSTGAAGNISVSADRGITFADSNSGLFAETIAEGKAGSITVNTPELTLQQDAEISTSTTGSGKAGDITLDTDILKLASGGKVLAFTTGSGDGGTITVNAPKEVNLGIGVQDFEPIISVETNGAGKAGDIFLTTPTLTLSDTARITATATATATNKEEGGSISLNASKMDLAGIVGVFAETQGESPAGTLTLKPDNNKPILDLTLAPGAKISASTSAGGKGGDLLVSAPQAINISGQGKLAVETTGTGNAGNIELNTQKLTLRDGVEISASTSEGAGGTITVEANTFDAMDGAKLLTTTSGKSKAGSISLNVSDNITLTGANTELLANTTPESIGDGGSIFIDPRTIVIGDGARVAVSSEGQGKGGDIEMRSGSLTLDNGKISADTASTDPEKTGGDIEIFSGSLTLDNASEISAKTDSRDGGNITLRIDDDPLLLRRNSSISTNAGTSQDMGGNGGNIEINAPFIIAFPTENSDITANAGLGNGGNINIFTNAIFGIEFRDGITDLSDFTVSSDFGAPGAFDEETLGIDPTRGLITLPEETVNTQISQGCQTVRGKEAVEYFEIGRGGSPPTPYDPLNADAVLEDWIDLEPKSENDSNSGKTINSPQPAKAEPILSCPDR